jgi:molybdopterin synthase catalytic subunit
MCEIQIRLLRDPIDTLAVLASVHDPRCGAQMLFLGCTRETTGDKQTTLLTYEAYETMATDVLHEIALSAAARWPLYFLTIHHRLGIVAAGESSIAVAASSPHRPPVMEALPWLLDTIKSQVPIWKQERFHDGSTEWIHP